MAILLILKLNLQKCKHLVILYAFSYTVVYDNQSELVSALKSLKSLFSRSNPFNCVEKSAKDLDK